jgi:hydrogenase maturation protease
VGVHVVERLQTAPLPDEVELLDGGTAGLDLLAVVEGRHSVIVIDAVDGDMPPGTMYRFTPDQIETTTVRLDSLHQFGLLETLRMAELIGGAPESTVIIGVQPETIGWGEALTGTIEGALPRIIKQVRQEIDAAVESYRNTANESKKTG